MNLNKKVVGYIFMYSHFSVFLDLAVKRTQEALVHGDDGIDLKKVELKFILENLMKTLSGVNPLQLMSSK
jgi:hypothetical protein